MELPGWNSIETTNWISDLFFWLSILALILLGATEVISHRYGERHDWLLGQKHQTEKSASDTEIARLHRDTADANARAVEAASDAAKLGLSVGNLHDFVAQQTDTNNAVIADLKSNTKDLERARADAITAAGEAKKTLDTVNEAIKPRTIANEGAFVEAVKPFAGLSVNVITPPSTTPDAGPLGQLLVALLKRADWKVGWGNPMSGWAKFVLVGAGKNPKPNVLAAATAIVTALRASGMQAFLAPEYGPEVPITGVAETVPNPDMTIIVGARQ